MAQKSVQLSLDGLPVEGQVRIMTRFRSRNHYDRHAMVLQHGAMSKFGDKEQRKRDSPSALGGNDQATFKTINCESERWNGEETWRQETLGSCGEGDNTRTVKIRRGFGGILYDNYSKELPL